MLLDHVPHERVACLVAASIRPQYLEALHDLAARLDVPCLVQPKASDETYTAFRDALRRSGSDSLMCYSYSMLLRRDILDFVHDQAVNLHASLLPRNRGPNPVQWALIRDEDRTGVTLHYMSEQVDAGDVIAQHSILIEESDTWVSLVDKVDAMSHKLLHEAVPQLLAGTATRHPQDTTLATTNRRLTADSPCIDFEHMSNRDIFNLIRAQIHPLRGAYLVHRGKRRYIDQPVSLEGIAHLRSRYASPVTTASQGDLVP